MIAWWQWRRRAHCPHSRLYAIWGDAINSTPGFRRLGCLDCGRLLDGSPLIAAARRESGEQGWDLRPAVALPPLVVPSGPPRDPDPMFLRTELKYP